MTGGASWQLCIQKDMHAWHMVRVEVLTELDLAQQQA